MSYPKSYHVAVRHLIEHGCWRHTTVGRLLVARALRDLRATFDRERGQRERRHMRQITGQFPVKAGHPLSA